mmetsp:Transcript_29449/g.83928  ORF Transcript_29449/g.83928 Transcript_29449/m.83928 type:complete len:268 (-) Transcript_29449:32-835(-)
MASGPAGGAYAGGVRAGPVPPALQCGGEGVAEGGVTYAPVAVWYPAPQHAAPLPAKPRCPLSPATPATESPHSSSGGDGVTAAVLVPGGSPGAGLFEADSGYYFQSGGSPAAAASPQGYAQAFPPQAHPPQSASMAGVDLASISVGSAGHATRECRPCAFARSSSGCKFGTDCHFCHIVEEHPESVRVRPCKGKRERLKRQMDAIEKAVAEDPDLLTSGKLALPPLLDRGSSSRIRVMAHLAQVAADAYRIRGGGGQGSAPAATMSL